MSTRKQRLPGSDDEHWTGFEDGDAPSKVDADRRRFLQRSLSRWHAFGLKRSLWRISTVMASTAVVTFALLYVVEPTSSAVTFKDRIGGNAPPGSVVLYGSVLNGKSPVTGARVTVTQASSGRHGGGARTTGKIVGSESTDDQGTYRLQLFVSPGEYTVDITLANGSQHSGFQFQLSNSSSNSASPQGGNGSAPNAETTGFISHSRFQPTNRHGGSGSGQGYGATGTYSSGGSGSGGGSGNDGSFPGDKFRLLSADQVLSLVPGVAYDVSAQVTISNFLSFLPVSSY